MKSPQQFRTISLIFLALVIGLVARTIAAQNDQIGFSQFRHFLGGFVSDSQHSMSTLQSRPHVHIVEATYGDKSTGNTCVPNLRICKETSECEFKVDDGLCDVDSKVKTLEVVWDCGAGSDIKTSTAVKGAKMSLVCGN